MHGQMLTTLSFELNHMGPCIISEMEVVDIFTREVEQLAPRHTVADQRWRWGSGQAHFNHPQGPDLGTGFLREPGKQQGQL